MVELSSECLEIDVNLHLTLLRFPHWRSLIMTFEQWKKNEGGKKLHQLTWKLMTWRQIDLRLPSTDTIPSRALQLLCSIVAKNEFSSSHSLGEKFACWEEQKDHQPEMEPFTISSAFVLINVECIVTENVTNKSCNCNKLGQGVYCSGTRN